MICTWATFSALLAEADEGVRPTRAGSANSSDDEKPAGMPVAFSEEFIIH